MSSSVYARRSSDPQVLPEKFGATPLRVGIESEVLGIGSVAFDALFAHYGSVKAMAFELGQVDPSLVRRELKACNFSRFDQYAKADARAVFSKVVNAQWAPLTNPDDRAAAMVAHIFNLLHELGQYIALRRTA